MRLAVNIDHVATLRQARGGQEPDPVTAAHIAEGAGSKGIVCHLREDRRHIQEQDVRRLRQTIRTKLDLEMAAVEEIVRFAVDVGPDLATLVPERREELTTEGGLDVRSQLSLISDVVKELHGKKIQVSLFVDPVREQVEAAKASGSDMIEIHTGEYANAQSEDEKSHHLQRIREMAELGKRLGVGVNAGHGLDYENVLPIVRIGEIDEVSIGYAIVTRALYVGMERAVREMVQLIKSP